MSECELLEHEPAREARAHLPVLVSDDEGAPKSLLATLLQEVVAAPGCRPANSRAECGRAELRTLFEGLHEGVMSIAPDGRIEFANSTMSDMLGMPDLEKDRKVPKEWLGFPLRSYVDSLLQAPDRVDEGLVNSRDGVGAFEITGIAVGSAAVLLVVTDVSERERRQRVEREFVANAAHELRTPLAAITSSIERLQAGAREVPETRDRYIGHIQHESNRLNRLAASLLVLARAQTREEEPWRERVLLRGLLDELVEGLEVRQEVELVLDCPRDLQAFSNRDLLEHALLNLVENAVAHTAKGEIWVSACVQDAGSVMIQISDTGVGIPGVDLDSVFDRFFRGSDEESRPGFGLGLAIAREAVQALGGDVDVESVRGAGTTVRIVLPGFEVPVLMETSATEATASILRVGAMS